MIVGSTFGRRQFYPCPPDFRRPSGTDHPSAEDVGKPSSASEPAAGILEATWRKSSNDNRLRSRLT
jgi:hypothetical protein